MYRLFGIRIGNKSSDEPTPRKQPGYFTKQILKLVDWLSKMDAKASKKQRIRGLIIFFLLMLSIYALSFWWQFAGQRTIPFQPDNMVLPRDIAIPDSLDRRQQEFNQRWLQSVNDSINQY